MTELIGRTIGDYQVTGQLGEGGMGVVYRGQHTGLGQQVAIKSLHPTLVNNQAARDRFQREAQALARLNHPNIIKLLNFVNDPNGCFIVMEFAEGEDLEQKCTKMGLIPPQQCLPWFIQACRGLNYAHQQGIIHRDIKPSNILVHPSGTTKLLDFGTAKLVDAARLTQHGMTLGTVIYMSKEQLLGRALDARSDVYSLGVTLYECVTGKLPFFDDEERKLIKKIAKEDPVPPSKHYPDISPSLEQVILKAMAKEPQDRFQSTTEFEHALSGLHGSGSVHVSSGAVMPPPEIADAGPPAPSPGPTPAAEPSGGVSELILAPMFLAGMVVLILAAGGATFAALTTGTGRIVGAVATVVLLILGVVLVALAARGRKGAAPGAGGPTCPTCSRAMLPGMSFCPFCNPEKVQVPAGVDQMPPGGTLNVNSAPVAEQPPPPTPVPAQVPAGASGSLKVVDGSDKGQLWTFDRTSPVTIGRAPTCVATLNDPGVSGQHAQVIFDGAGFSVEDTHSRNGVWVNNQKVAGRQSLKTGDLIVIGSTRMLVTLSG